MRWHVRDDRPHMLVRQCLQILGGRTDERETVESHEPRYARNALSDFKFNLSRGVEQQ
jgi:hypothetical protein